MKMKRHHYVALLQAIRAVETKHAACLEGFKKQVTPMRYRWDLLYAIPRDVRQPIMDALYQYCDDTHIDTALKAITGVK
jgi:hypothetical protein